MRDAQVVQLDLNVAVVTLWGELIIQNAVKELKFVEEPRILDVLKLSHVKEGLLSPCIGNLKVKVAYVFAQFLVKDGHANEGKGTVKLNFPQLNGAFANAVDLIWAVSVENLHPNVVIEVKGIELHSFAHKALYLWGLHRLTVRLRGGSVMPLK